MATDPDPILEVEVLEIDGKAPPQPAPSARPAPTRGSGSWTNWQRWPGQVRTIHPLWWPVILVAGGILLFLVLTLGLVVAVLVTIFRLIRAVLRALFS